MLSMVLIRIVLLCFSISLVLCSVNSAPTTVDPIIGALQDGKVVEYDFKSGSLNTVSDEKLKEKSPEIYKFFNSDSYDLGKGKVDVYNFGGHFYRVETHEKVIQESTEANDSSDEETASIGGVEQNDLESGLFNTESDSIPEISVNIHPFFNSDSEPDEIDSMETSYSSSKKYSAIYVLVAVALLCVSLWLKYGDATKTRRRLFVFVTRVKTEEFEKLEEPDCLNSKEQQKQPV